MHPLPKRRRFSPILSIENLEIRNLLSGIMSADLPPAVPEMGPNETVDQATDLGSSGSAAVDGKIDRNGVDVDWYSFTLLVSSEVTFDSTSGVLGLYNSAARDPNDQLNPFGYRLLVQQSADGTDGAQITRTLAAGTYYVAVSGLGNTYFNPFLADSGLAGETGTYTLEFTSTPIAAPGPGDLAPLSLDVSPMVIRADFAGNLDFSPTVELTDAAGNVVSLAWSNFNSTTHELQFAPNSALAAGDYTAVVKDALGTVRMTLQVRVTQTTDVPADEGDDTPATAIDLGELDNAGLLQIPGVIGDDSYYDFSSIDPSQRPANDVDLYHFQITSKSPIGIQAEIFAGRIGSPLDAGISLYRLNPTTGKLEFIAGNNNTYNGAIGTDGRVPLYTDSTLASGLEAGDYYLAVSSGLNTPAPIENQTAGGKSGIFDPTLSHSGSSGLTVGPYILNLRTVNIPDPPKVVAVSIQNQSKLPTAPTELSIQFSQFVNVSELAFISHSTTLQDVVPGIYIQDSQGNKYFPHFVSFDPLTLTAHFEMSDRLPSGDYQLHLSGSGGISNIIGAPLVGNNPSGDYLVNFTVAAPAAGTAGNPTNWTHDSGTDATDSTQPLGVLFPAELKAGVNIVRKSGGSTKDETDEYSFELLTRGRYFLTLSGDKLPAEMGIQVLDENGKVVASATVGEGPFVFASLKPGKYVLRLSGWSTIAAKNVNYQVGIQAISFPDDPPPLFSGPGAAIGIRLATSADTGGGPGSGPIGSGPGGIGSGGNGSGSGPGASIPNVGTSTSVSSSQSPNDYRLNQLGLPRLNIPSDLDNFVIAIPTVTSGSGASVGSRLQVARSLRRISGLREGLAPARLSEFADGPVGSERRNDSRLTSDLTAVRKLSRLIDSALVSKRELDRNQPKQLTNAPPSRDEAPIVADQDQVLQQQGELDPAAPAEGDAQPVDSNHTTEVDTKRSRLSAQIHNTSHLSDAQTFEYQTANDSAFIPFAPEYDHDQWAEATALEAAYLPDTVFAAGMGLLVVHTAAQRRGQSSSDIGRKNEVHSTSPGSLRASKRKQAAR